MAPLPSIARRSAQFIELRGAKEPTLPTCQTASRTTEAAPCWGSAHHSSSFVALVRRLNAPEFSALVTQSGVNPLELASGAWHARGVDYSLAPWALTWDEVDPSRHSFDAASASGVIRKLAPASAVPTRPSDGVDYRQVIDWAREDGDAWADSMARAVVDRFGHWACGWRWAIDEGDFGGGPVGSWCCSTARCSSRGWSAVEAIRSSSHAAARKASRSRGWAELPGFSYTRPSSRRSPVNARTIPRPPVASRHLGRHDPQTGT